MTDPATGEQDAPTPAPGAEDPWAPEPLADRPRRVAVLGGGITGLAAAHRLHVLDPDLQVTVLEAGDRAGGAIRTSPLHGQPIDEAADAFLARVPEAVALCHELGLADELTTPAARSAFVAAGGVLRRLPEGLVLGVPTDLDALAASGIVSAAGVARAAEDLDRPADGPPPGVDESVGALVRRRLGDEVADRLVAPLLGGVNAGDADRLSLAAGAPQLAAATRGQPSLIAGLRAQRAAATTEPDAPVFHALRGGTGTLVDALVAALPDGTVRTATVATGIDRLDAGYRIHLGRPGPPTGRPARPAPRGHVDVDAAVVALPAWAGAAVLGTVPDLVDVAAELAALEWASVAMAALVVRRDDVDHPLDGSGALIPAAERRHVTACSFGSTKWAHWGDDDQVVLRASVGHAGDDGAALAVDDATLLARVLADLEALVGLHGPPVATRVSRWPRALPQYRPGHLARARSWQRRTWERTPALWPTGASYAGLGVPACIRQGDAAARLLLDR